MASTINRQNALIFVMVTMSTSDNVIGDDELRTIGGIVESLPIFHDVDRDALVAAAQDCVNMLEPEDGLDAVLGLVKEALSPALRETAYALACEVAAADGKLEQEELRLLEMIRDELEVDRLHAAAIERGVRARYTTA
jgi:tellurite resistance protein